LSKDFRSPANPPVASIELSDNGIDRFRSTGLTSYPSRGLQTVADPEAAHRADLLLDLFEHTSDLIQLIGIDGRIELVNPAWCETLGYSQAEAIGLNVFNLIAPDCQEHCQHLFQDLLAQASGRTIHCAFLARSGQRIELEGQLDVALEGGTPVRVRGILRDVTARRGAERALQALNDSLETRIRESTAALLSSEARLREAQALARVGHWDLDLSSGAVHWSDEICRIAGLDPAQVTPSYATFLERVHPEDRSEVDAVHQREAQFLQPFEFGYRLLLEGGEVRHIQARLVTHVAADGRPLRVIGTCQDVTPLVQSQRQLLEGEDKLRSLFELSPLGIALIGAGGRCLRTNDAFCRILRQGDHGQQPFTLAPESAQVMDRLRCAALASGDSSITSDHTLRCGDGHQLPVRLRAQRLLLEEPGGEEGLIWMMVEDLQENLAAQEGLRLAASVFRDAQEGIMITKPDGQIVEVNGAFSHITGYGREEVLGANPRLLKSGHHDPAFYARMWQQLNEEGTWSGEVVNRARDGATLEFFETISAVKDDNGSVSHYVALLTDISQLKQQQHQLERLAHFDALTGLPNRILLARRLEDAMAVALERGHRIAIGYLDLDGFKEVNDSLGHAAGDRLLQVLAARMAAALRPQDLLARLGGDEFVLVLEEIPSSGESLPILDQLLSTLEEPVEWNGVPMRVTASIGVTIFPQEGPQGLGPDQLLRHADQAMYNAKRLGRNRYALSHDLEEAGA